MADCSYCGGTGIEQVGVLVDVCDHCHGTGLLLGSGGVPRQTDVDEAEREGQEMLAARWDTPFADDDALDLARIEVRHDPGIDPVTGKQVRKPGPTEEYVEEVTHERDHTTLEDETDAEE